MSIIGKKKDPTGDRPEFGWASTRIPHRFGTSSGSLA
jgi:hypothetical protein